MESESKASPGHLQQPMLSAGHDSSEAADPAVARADELTRGLPTKKHVIITAVTCICTLAFALALPQLGDIFGLTGSLCAFPYCFIMPSLMYLWAPQTVWNRVLGQSIQNREQWNELASGSDVHAPTDSSSDSKLPLNSTISAADFLYKEGKLVHRATGTIMPPPHTKAQRYGAWSMLVFFSICCVISVVVSMQSVIKDL